MAKEERRDGSHVLLLPYPTQGHINPMLQFAKRLVSKGVKATLATTVFISNTVQFDTGAISVIPISDGCDEGGFAEVGSVSEYLKRQEAAGSRTLGDLIEHLRRSGQNVTCLIYDAFFPWALDVALKHRLRGAAFFTQMCIVNAIYYHVYHGNVAVPLASDHNQTPLRLPGLPPLEIDDMPSFIAVWGSYPAYKELVLDQFRNLEKAAWVLLNTFHELEPQAVEWMAGMFPVRSIGPTLPSVYLDKRVEGDTGYDINLDKLDAGPLMKWLDDRVAGSVVYVSFGSLASLGVDQMLELACGLKRTERPFLWMVKESEKHKLPEKLAESTAEMGLLVSWCPQVEVLSHPAVGCFLTHCGWNSTLEALSLGVPMVAMPQWTDQPTDAKCVEDLWRVGVRARADEKGIVRKEELELRVRQVMEGERREEFKKNARKWKDLAKQAVVEGGSSDRNIDEFVASLLEA